MKPNLPAFCMALCLVAASVACQRTPPAPAPTPNPTPAPQPSPEPPALVTPPAADVAPDKPIDEPMDWMLPGSLGPLTTRLQLETRFGKTNVNEETFDSAEGEGTYSALVIFPDDPRKRLELVQDADNPDAPIMELRVSTADSNWHDTSGLRTGMTLAELVAINGAPVSFYGLDWDYGGTVQDWHGGKLANPVDAKVFRRIRLGTRHGAGGSRLPQGDNSFRSDDVRFPTIGDDLVVGQLGISWPHEGED